MGITLVKNMRQAAAEAEFIRRERDTFLAIAEQAGPAYFERRERELGIFGPWTQRLFLNEAPPKVREWLRKAKDPRWKSIRMDAQAFTGAPIVGFPPVGFTAITASATETNLWTPNTQTPVAAGSAVAGQLYILEFAGIFSSTVTQGVLTWTHRWGQSATPASNVTLGASNATAPPASLTNAPWFGMSRVGIQSIGVTATSAKAIGNCFVHVQGAAAATAVDYLSGTGATPATVDTLSAQGVIVSLTISVASQSYTCQWAVLRRCGVNG